MFFRILNIEIFDNMEKQIYDKKSKSSMRILQKPEGNKAWKDLNRESPLSLPCLRQDLGARENGNSPPRFARHCRAIS